jgi:hypothetical protein
MADAVQVAEGILALVEERLMAMGKKGPPSSLRDTTSPSQADGEDLSADPPANESKERSQ